MEKCPVDSRLGDFPCFEQITELFVIEVIVQPAADPVGQFF